MPPTERPRDREACRSLEIFSSLSAEQTAAFPLFPAGQSFSSSVCLCSLLSVLINVNDTGGGDNEAEAGVGGANWPVLLSTIE